MLFRRDNDCFLNEKYIKSSFPIFKVFYAIFVKFSTDFVDWNVEKSQQGTNLLSSSLFRRDLGRKISRWSAGVLLEKSLRNFILKRYQECLKLIHSQFEYIISELFILVICKELLFNTQTPASVNSLCHLASITLHSKKIANRTICWESNK